MSALVRQILDLEPFAFDIGPLERKNRYFGATPKRAMMQKPVLIDPSRKPTLILSWNVRKQLTIIRNVLTISNGCSSSSSTNSFPNPHLVPTTYNLLWGQLPRHPSIFCRTGERAQNNIVVSKQWWGNVLPPLSSAKSIGRTGCHPSKRICVPICRYAAAWAMSDLLVRNGHGWPHHIPVPCASGIELNNSVPFGSRSGREQTPRYWEWIAQNVNLFPWHWWLCGI